MLQYIQNKQKTKQKLVENVLLDIQKLSHKQSQYFTLLWSNVIRVMLPMKKKCNLLSDECTEHKTYNLQRLSVLT
jgi:hypothetical protein